MNGVGIRSAGLALGLEVCLELARQDPAVLPASCSLVAAFCLSTASNSEEELGGKPKVPVAQKSATLDQVLAQAVACATISIASLWLGFAQLKLVLDAQRPLWQGGLGQEGLLPGGSLSQSSSLDACCSSCCLGLSMP